MANGHGGKRTPRNPAPVSGPGALSRRTDGKQNAQYVPGLPYGEGQDFYDLQTSAPMAEAPRPANPKVQAGNGGASATGITPFDAPTERPDEPVTAGAPVGPGPGPEVLSSAPGMDDVKALKRWLPVIEPMAQAPDTPDSVRALIRYIRGA